MASNLTGESGTARGDGAHRTDQQGQTILGLGLLQSQASWGWCCTLGWSLPATALQLWST